MNIIIENIEQEELQTSFASDNSQFINDNEAIVCADSHAYMFMASGSMAANVDGRGLREIT